MAEWLAPPDGPLTLEWYSAARPDPWIARPAHGRGGYVQASRVWIRVLGWDPIAEAWRAESPGAPWFREPNGWLLVAAPGHWRSSPPAWPALALALSEQRALARRRTFQAPAWIYAEIWPVPDSGAPRLASRAAVPVPG